MKKNHIETTDSTYSHHLLGPKNRNKHILPVLCASPLCQLVSVFWSSSAQHERYLFDVVHDLVCIFTFFSLWRVIMELNFLGLWSTVLSSKARVLLFSSMVAGNECPSPCKLNLGRWVERPAVSLATISNQATLVPTRSWKAFRRLTPDSQTRLS